jgi:predicted enzyme related to lactoylglutathione lyase
MQGDWFWHELITPDPQKAGEFYGKLLGWKTTDMPMANGMTYTLWQRAGQNHGGMMKPPMPGIPPHWETYVKVDDVDAIADRVPRLGGMVHVPPTDIPNVGRFAVIGDPTGAVLAVITPKMP